MHTFSTLLSLNLNGGALVGLVDVALSGGGEAVEGHVGHAVIVDEGGGDDEDVEDLVRLEPDVELARKEAFGDAAAVEHCAKDVEASHD